MLSLPPDAAAALHDIDVEITEITRVTDKTVLATGNFRGRHAAIKILRSSASLWLDTWQREQRTYSLFAQSQPPVPVPAVLAASERVLILDWIEGSTLDEDRYPHRQLSAAHTEAVLSTVAAVNRWQPHDRCAVEHVFDYPDRFRRYHARGLLTDHDYHALLELLPAAGIADQFNHGDLLASNIIVGNHLTLLDWEFAGWYLPGWDLAVVHTMLGAATPTLKDHIDTAVTDSGIEAAFTVNLAVLLIRELRIHSAAELPDRGLRQRRLPVIEAAWSHARERLHTLTSGRHP